MQLQTWLQTCFSSYCCDCFIYITHYTESDAAVANQTVSSPGIATFWITVIITYVMSYIHLWKLQTGCSGIPTLPPHTQEEITQGPLNMILCQSFSCDSCQLVTLIKYMLCPSCKVHTHTVIMTNHILKGQRFKRFPSLQTKCVKHSFTHFEF